MDICSYSCNLFCSHEAFSTRTLREKETSMFEKLEHINQRPESFEIYTADALWTDEHTSQRMLAYHLNTDIDVSSRRGEFIERSVTWITSHFRLGEGSSVADFGCGPGLYANKLAKSGALITGIDFSKRSIEHARKTARAEHVDVRYIHQNYLEFESSDQFNLIMMIMCDFCALSPAQRRYMLDTFYSTLLPGGSLLLDVYSLNAFLKRTEKASYEVNLLDGFWSLNVYNWLQYFDVASVEKEFQHAGFTLTEYYADVAGSAFDPEHTEFAVVGLKS